MLFFLANLIYRCVSLSDVSQHMSPVQAGFNEVRELLQRYLPRRHVEGSQCLANPSLLGDLNRYLRAWSAS
jgi:hypothetical protein